MDLNTRAILQPSSASARHSFRLPLNKDVIVQSENPLLRVPYTTDSDDDDDSIRTRLQESFLVEEALDLHSINLGSGYENEIVLQHHPNEEDGCYINLQHCQLYLDPDSPDVWVYNSSTTTFAVKKMNSSGKVMIYPEDCTSLSTGTWDIKLGSGLDFIIKVCGHGSSGPGESTYGQTVATIEVTSSPKVKSLRRTKVKSIGKRKVESIGKTKMEPIEKPSVEPIEKTNVESIGKNEVESIGRTDVDFIGKTMHSRVVSRLVDGNRRAVKICRRPKAPIAAKMWLQEVNMLKMIGEHSNIVQLIQSSASRREIVLSLVPGQSLDRFMDRSLSTLSTEDCTQVWQGGARGLSWIHSKGIIHNDIKPGNVMYDSQKRTAVLIDFGIATQKILSQSSGSGTPWYAGPETLLRQRSYPYDVWSLGVTLLVAFGELSYPDRTEESWRLASIFADDNEATKMNKWLRTVESTRDRLPESSFSLLKLMLTRNSTKRIRSQDLVSELESRRRATNLLSTTQ